VATWPSQSLELRNSDLAVWPREAVAWMHRNPSAEHLVPTTPAQMVDDTTGQHVSGVAMGGTVMAHVPDWERLPDALKRVMATTGVAEHQAKLDLCRAISDRKIKVRFLVGKEEGSFRSIGEQVEGMVRHGSDADIATQLKPSDFDWQQSRQLQPWQDIQGGFGVISGLEVLRADVTKVLCGSGSKDESPQAPSPHEGRQQRRRGKSLA
jgi:hypothetical protein